MSTIALVRPAMPTSGSARRKAKAQRNLGRSYELESIAALIHGGIPAHAAVGTVCSCGFRQWLMPGYTAEEREDFDRVNADHGDSCSDLYGGAW